MNGSRAGGLPGRPLPASWAAEGRGHAAGDRGRFSVPWTGSRSSRPSTNGSRAERTDRRVAAVGPGQEEAVLARLAADCDYTILIAPETGGVLGGPRGAGRAGGGRSLGSTPPAVALTTDKRLLAGHLPHEGIGRPERTVSTPAGLPAISRTRRSSSRSTAPGRWTPIIARVPVTDRFAPRLPAEMVIQPYCPGVPLSATFLVGPSGAIRLVGVGWQTDRSDRGGFHVSGGRLPSPGRALRQGNRSPPSDRWRDCRGIVGVDFVRDEATGESDGDRDQPEADDVLRRPGSAPAPRHDRAGLARPVLGQGSGDDLRGMIAPGPGRRSVF